MSLLFLYEIHIEMRSLNNKIIKSVSNNTKDIFVKFYTTLQ